MALIGGSTNWTKTENPVKRRLFWRWSTSCLVPYAYIEEQSIRYEWETDFDGYSSTTLNPESLAATNGWACEWYGGQKQHAKLHGTYLEVYVKRGGFTLL
jgi:hypothetical protein